MKSLRIEPTDKTPLIDFDPSTGKFEISGKSIPQDAEAFYAPVLEWMEQYISSTERKTDFTLNLEYFNISSSKRILFLLYKLNELADREKEVSVKWYYAETDDDMKEVGHDFAFMVRVPFEFIPYSRKPVMAQ